MDDLELEALLRDAESDRVERKASPAERDRIREAVCAFANDLPDHRRPGVIFIGVHDDGGCAIAVVTVYPSDSPPVRYRGRVCIRVGLRRAYATAEEERRLNEKRRAKDLPYDLRPLSSASLEDLDLEHFRTEYVPSSLPPEIVEQNQRSTEEQLASMRLVTPGPDLRPTVLGALVLGKDPMAFLPGAYVQFLRFDGTALTDPIKDSASISGPLAVLLRRLDEKLRIHITVSTDITSKPVEVRRPDYPIVALEQLTRNAVLHRNYEGTSSPVRVYWFNDRIEILSPGGPFGQVSRQNFGQPGITDYRNPHLAEAMKNLGYVQRFGVGIPIARAELEKNGNPPPDFVVEDTHVLAIVRRRV